MNHRRARCEGGFALVELLVVLLIIGLLAAIGLPTFLSQTGKAHDASAKTDVRTAQIALEAYRVEKGDYCGASVSDLKAIETTLQSANNLTVSTCQGGNVTQYDLSVKSRSGTGTVYSVSLSDGAVVSRTCNTPGQGGCASNGTW